MDNKLQNIALGVDIGGSHITAVAVNMETKAIIPGTIAGLPVDNKAEAHEIIDVWSEALKNVLKKVNLFNVRGIGFAMPGPFDYVKGICLIRGVPKYEKLYGVNVGKAISSKLGLPCDCRVRFMNDASSFAVGEAWAGKAKDYRRSMAITLGTGFGSAFLDDKIPVVDGESVPKMGCVYHLPFEKGIADDYFSTRWLVGRYEEKTGHRAEGAKEVADAAKKDAAAKEVFDEFGENLGSFLSPWLIKFGAEVLVIGGNISYAYDLFGERFENRLKAEGCNIKVEISGLKEDAALLGSAYLLDDSFWKAVQHALPLM
ncbi:MAG TPA: ROK family protein [Bacteroidales bacterium]|mgnify:CR=1 FL=1|nr:ROK family protein [Bacteroidales bacterium]HPT11772.1 ROK family protein [Bacteroidales bacterium]